jgi:hypothetical protein
MAIWDGLIYNAIVEFVTQGYPSPSPLYRSKS